MPATIVEGNPNDEQFRRRRELAETAARGALGGVFYVLGWFVVAVCGGLHRREPALVVAGGIVFAALMFARITLARRETADADTIVRLLVCWWTLLLVTAALWGATATWALVDSRMQEARLPALICSVAFGAAFVHTYATRWHYALCGVTLLLLPVVVIAWTVPDFGGVAFSLTVFVVYLLSSLRLSWQQYDRQLLLELALLHQRDLYEKQSRTDALTGLDNRREFTFNLERALTVGEPLSLLLIDIDHFKQINDRHGHAAGDAVLIAFAGQLREHFAPADARVARIGGEEFAVLLAGVGEDAAAASAAALCRRIAAAPLAPDARRGAVTISIGVGELRDSRRQRLDDFLVTVDRSLYRAKAEGRNRVCRVGG
ncbi:MAG TPA: GGDEF domain-containing protein [Tahibacter sp.]|uniref:GGDEF domain-containing protein n=1 Tax=Tahibacter sp. TaxID=2056211 RepID=UPI002CD1A582|nr:GGDEF domain-containing protein [Tahibacter sp.]HSX59031.1 GGDEF domain-containing protein [Tahibacter sp.]